jgi:hypothetical protein
MHNPWERDVTASPDSSVDKISSEPLAAKAPPSRDSSSLPLTGFQLWLHRVWTLLFVFFCATVGVLLVILPWRPEWTDNHFLLSSPGLRTFVSNGFVRGLCSGLGLLDIWIGFWEAVHFHDEKRY